MSLTRHLGVIRKISDFAIKDYMENYDVVSVTLEKWDVRQDVFPLEFVKASGRKILNIPVLGYVQPSHELFIELFKVGWPLGKQILSVFPNAKNIIRGTYVKDHRYVDVLPEMQYRPDDVRINPAVGDLMQVNIDYQVGQVKIYKIATKSRLPINLSKLPIRDRDDMDSDEEQDEVGRLYETMMESLKPQSPEELEIAHRIKLILNVSIDADIDALISEHGEEVVAENIQSFYQKMDNPEERWEYQQKMLTYPYRKIKEVFAKIRS